MLAFETKHVRRVGIAIVVVGFSPEDIHIGHSKHCACGGFPLDAQ